MRRIVRGRGLLWVVGIGLGLCVVISVCVVLVTHNRASLDSQASETFEPGVVVPSSSPTTESVVTAVDTPPQIPRLDFPPGSVGDACGLNEFVPYNFDDPDNEYYWPKSPHDKDVKLVALESEICQLALENHVNTINPYLYLWGAARAKYS